MTEKIEPALMAEEWAQWIERGKIARLEYLSRALPQYGGQVTIDGEYGPEDQRALAAALLQGKSFGFTWEDVRLLRQEARDYRNGFDPELGPLPDLADRYDSIADRIAALLPPRDNPKIGAV